jgi:hypothetical protein
MSRPIPKEAANLANTLGNQDFHKVTPWLREASATELLEFIACLGNVDYNKWHERARAELEARLADDAAKLADKMIQHTDKLTQQTDKLVTESVNLSKLTRILIWLTMALGLFAVVQIVIMVFDCLKHK